MGLRYPRPPQPLAARALRSRPPSRRTADRVRRRHARVLAGAPPAAPSTTRRASCRGVGRRLPLTEVFHHASPTTGSTARLGGRERTVRGAWPLTELTYSGVTVRLLIHRP